MRHRIVREYLNVERSLVWEVVTRDLSALISALDTFVPEPEGG